MKALVTGAAGFAGRHLVAALAADGHEVVGSALPQEAGAAGLLPLDVTDAGATRELLARARPDWVFHLAGLAHVAEAEADPEATLRVNLGGTLTLLEACLDAAAASRVLLISSAEVYGPAAGSEMPLTEDRPLRPATAYATSKACAEMAGHHALARGLDVVLLRPFNHIGPGQSEAFVASAFARQIARIEAGLQPPRLAVGNLGAVRDFSDVRQTVRGYLAAARGGRRGETYNVTSGAALSIRELLETLRGLARVPLEVAVDPARLRPLDVPVFRGSPEKLATHTGFRARFDARATLGDVLDYWRATLAAPAAR